MVKSFKQPGAIDMQADTTDIEVLREVEKLLSLHGYETSDLIHQYYKERINEQKQIEDGPIGLLTIQTYFHQNTLEVRVIGMLCKFYFFFL